MPIWLLATAAGGIGAWIGSLSTAAVITPSQQPAQPNYTAILFYAAAGIGLVYAGKKVLK